LQQAQAQPKRFGCGNFTVIGPLIGKPGQFGVKSLFCGSYRCDRCRKPKLKKVRARLAEIATEHKLQRMATLTLDRKKLSRGVKSDRYIRECWRKMRVLLSRKYGKSLPFIAVLEFQENGMAHLHVLLGVYIPQAWLSRAWQSIGGGKIVDIRFVNVRKVSAYLAVYLAGDKVIHTLELLQKRARIFTTSRSIVLWGKKVKRGWFMRRVSISALYDAAAAHRGLVRFEAVEDLKAFGLEMLSYFESPPFQEAIGGREILQVLRDSLPTWKAERFRLLSE
jgi:hypothetical protein